MIVNENLLQGSDEWFRLRQGRPTGSEFSRIITAKTAKLSTQRHGYMQELVAETYIPSENCMESSWLFTGKKFIGNVFTDHGNEIEEEARAAFAERTGLTPIEVGFVTRDDGVVGVSPDSLMKDADGNWSAGLEIKCKCLKNHIDALVSGDIPDAHKAQVHGCLAVTGLSEWHFWSYFPEMEPVHFIVTPDDYTAKISEALDTFLIEYAEFRDKWIPRLKITKQPTTEK